MIVVDASVVVDYVLDTIRAPAAVRAMFGQRLRAPDIIDFEVLAAIQRLTNSGAIDRPTGAQSLSDLSLMKIRRAPSGPLLTRAFELRNSVATGDALYVALAERLDCPLMTADGRLARCHGHRANIQMID